MVTIWLTNCIEIVDLQVLLSKTLLSRINLLRRKYKDSRTISGEEVNEVSALYRKVI